MNVHPTSGMNWKNCTQLAVAKPRERKYDIGTIGYRARRSQATKSTTSSAPPTSPPMTSPLLHPTLGARTAAQVSPNAPSATKMSPARSSCGRGPRLSRIFRAESTATTTPMGTLIQKIHCQEMYWVSAPPTRGPVVAPRPVTPPHMPIAAIRFSGGKASLIRARVSGSTAAAPAPSAPAR